MTPSESNALAVEKLLDLSWQEPNRQVIAMFDEALDAILHATPPGDANSWTQIQR